MIRNKLITYKHVILTLFIASIAGYLFVQQMDATFVSMLILVLWVLVVFIYKLHYVVSAKLGLLGLVLVALLLTVDSRDFAEKIAVMTYMMLICGFVQYVYETRDNI